MGRLSNLIVNATSTSSSISTESTTTNDVNNTIITNNNLINNILSGETTGVTNIDVHIFIDEKGNVTQIKKYSKPRLKYYIDPNFPDAPVQEHCVIGVSDPENGDCSEGTAMGVGDNESGGLMVYAVYE